jgi:REP element-mobilizing transposase RayT
MPYNPDIHHRQSIRLKNYDYSQAGAYFITICTHQKQCLFGNIKNGRMRLNHLGAIADQYWQQIPEHFPNTALDIYIIMPNHLHGILWIIESDKNEENPRKFGNIVKRSISSMMRSYKAVVTKEIKKACNLQGRYSIWQKRYYDQIIRSEKMLNNIRQYILENPINWDRDEEKPTEDIILFDIPF